MECSMAVGCVMSDLKGLMLVTSGLVKGNIGKWRFQFSHPQKFLGVPEIPADFPAATGSQSVEAAGNPQESETKGSFQRTNDGDRRTSSFFPIFKFCSGALFFNINRPVFRERRSQLVVRYLFVACFPKELPWKVIYN